MQPKPGNEWSIENKGDSGRQNKSVLHLSYIPPHTTVRVFSRLLLNSGVLMKPKSNCFLISFILVIPLTACSRTAVAVSSILSEVDQFIEAARRGDAPTVQSMISSGMDPNTHNSHGDTALLMAAANSHTEVVQMLVAAK